MNTIKLIRNCRKITANHSEQSDQIVTLDRLTELPAWVLLGDPGMGKTTTFKTLADLESADYCKASDFEMYTPIEPNQATVYIDGLDETRGLGSSKLQETIRRHINAQSILRFRLSSRAADWTEDNTQFFTKVLPPNTELPVYALVPLSDEQSKQLLADWGIVDANAFMETAQQRGVGDLLHNPQTLWMLFCAMRPHAAAEPVVWPSTRRDTYALASKSLLQEHSNKHAQLPAKEAMEYAGRLCAIYLLSNCNGIAVQSPVTPHLSATRRIYLSDISNDETELRQLATLLKQKLFTCSEGVYEPVYEPIHRSVTEYLAAQYLALNLTKTVSSSRLLNQLLAHDGGVVSNLRGMVAWLAVLCADTTIRLRLLNADPMAVLNYGDLSGLDIGAKTQLLQALSQLKNLGYISQSTAVAYAPLAMPDLSATAIRYLTEKNTPNRSVVNKDMAYLMAHALNHAPIQPIMIAPLEALVRDESQSDHTRRQALHALIYQLETNTQALLTLLSDIYTKTLRDPSQALRGVLLTHLFPKHIGANTIFNHIGAQFTGYFSANEFFWWQFVEDTRTFDPPLLQALANAAVIWLKTVFDPDGEHKHSKPPKAIIATLINAIVRTGKSAPLSELATWLEQCAMRALNRTDTQAFNHDMAAWIAQEHALVRTVQEYWLNDMDDNFHQVMYRAQYFPLPNDMPSWLLKLADQAYAKGQYEKCDYFLQRSTALYEPSTTTLVFPEDLEQWFSGKQLNNCSLESLLKSSLENQDWRLENNKYRLQQQAREQAWKIEDERDLDSLRKNIEFIQKGQHKEALLYMAWAALEAAGEPYVSNGGKFKRLYTHVQQDAQLSLAFRQGYIQCVLNIEPNTAVQALTLHFKKQQLLNHLPALLGAQHLFEDGAHLLLDLNTYLKKTLLLLYFLSGNREAAWVDCLRTQQPDHYISAWLEYAILYLKNGETQLSQLHLITHNNEYSEIAQASLPSLLNALPTKPTTEHINLYTQVLFASFKHVPNTVFATILLKHLRKKSINSAWHDQLLFWGLLSGDERFECARFKLALATELRVEALAVNCAFFVRMGQGAFETLKPAQLPPQTIAFLIGFFSVISRPSYAEPVGAGFVTRSHYAGDFVRSAIDFLAQSTHATARDLLIALSQLPRCLQWREHLDRVIELQSIALRELSFVIPSPQQMNQLLKASDPHSVSDMQAIVLDLLNDYQLRILGSELNYKTAFWKTIKNGNNKTYRPSDEGDCRDLIAQFLVDKLETFSIDIISEALQANQKRSDIQLRYTKAAQAKLRLPIEIKGDWHDQLWTAPEEQLLKLYMNDPASACLGIYLVVWTGLGSTALSGHSRRFLCKDRFEMAMSSHITSIPACSGIKLFVLDVSKP